ncbi:MAG TPA: L-threonylcarbamoyladenylate synthase [Xanthobacteraceae bacterium]|nr:L-threonylcarbamoyladenylate synthase [Xanthobacteraceae bacterium]
MQAVKTRIGPPNAETIAEAARILRAGGLVAFPTETVYGLGADATNAEAVARLYAAKGRPVFNPLIAHVRDTASARALAVFDAAAERLAAAFWPGPLTLVLPQRPGCPVAALATAGLDTIALRVPANSVAQALLRSFGGPVVAPSANLSGHVSPTTAQHVAADLDGRIDLIIDGGPTEVGLESTIVACLDGQAALLRPGGLPRGRLEAALGGPLASPPRRVGEAPAAPGQLASHYAPRARLRLEAVDVRPNEALLAFGPAPPRAAMLNLSAKGDLVEAAANLFSYLRKLDASGAPTIAVMPIPQEGLGEAINDRLRRAAAPR